MTGSNIRAFAWLKMMSAVLMQTTQHAKAAIIADEGLKEFDKRFNEYGEAFTPDLLTNVLRGVEVRLKAVEGHSHEPMDITALLTEQRQGFSAEVDELRGRLETLSGGTAEELAAVRAEVAGLLARVEEALTAPDTQADVKPGGTE